MSYVNPIWAEKHQALQEVRFSGALMLPILLKPKISLKVYILVQKIAFFFSPCGNTFQFHN